MLWGVSKSCYTLRMFLFFPVQHLQESCVLLAEESKRQQLYFVIGLGGLASRPNLIKHSLQSFRADFLGSKIISEHDKRQQENETGPLRRALGGLLLRF